MVPAGLELLARRSSAEDLPRALASLSTAARQCRRAKRRHIEVSAAQLAEWVKSSGVHHRNKIAHAMPQLAPHTPGLAIQFANEGLACAKFIVPTDLEVPRLLALRGMKEFDEVFGALLQEWSHLHDALLHKDQTPLPAPPAKNRQTKPSCSDAGH